MATYPGGIFSWTTVVDNTDDVLASHPNSIAAEVIALQTKVGVTGSAVTSTVDYLLSHLPAQDQNWDAGANEVRAMTFESDVVTGTAPIVVASTTVCTNLNADTVDGKHVAGTNGAGEITTNDGTQTLTNKTLTSPTVNGATLATVASLGFSSGATVTSVTDNDALGTSDTVLCTQGNTKAYADTMKFSYIYDYGTSLTTPTSKSQSSLKVCYGQAVDIAGSSSVSITGLPFTGPTTYKVTLSHYHGAKNYDFSTVRSSGSSFSITNEHVDAIGGNGTVDWIAIGT